MTRRPSCRPAERATDREVRVVTAVLGAGSAKAAADRLGPSHSTVKHHPGNTPAMAGAETTAQRVWVPAPPLPPGARGSYEGDGGFSKRVLLNEEIEVSYRDADGRARLLYLDRNYNDTLGLRHEDAHKDARPIDIPGVDKKLIEVRVLAPIDLAVSKLSRFGDQDRDDILLLAKEGLIDAASLRKRAEQALGGYVGDLNSVRNSIDIACRLIESTKKQISRAGP